MKSYILGLLATCLLCSCNEAPKEQKEVIITTPLYGFFTNAPTKSSEVEAVETLVSGNLYNVCLYPCCIDGDRSCLYISEVSYYLNGSFLCRTNSYPFTCLCTAGEPGEYLLTVVPTFSSPFVKWEAKPTEILIKPKGSKAYE